MPFEVGGGAEVFESCSAFDASLVIEMVVDGGMDEGELLQTLHLPEPEHGTFPPSKRISGHAAKTKVGAG